ncbi:MAG TPA: prepilin-type N-terminal cleavage/methylation domain-containing protein [Luteolibacter sp.]|nr:prepilin-type N-terminal cleavage/methylation domain-containing protein [Luteolibacter sp.]
MIKLQLEKTSFRLASPSRPGRGFTLVEILVVIAIVLVLALASIPLGKKLQDSAHAANCMSNLRQLGATIIMYAGDHGQKLPPLQPETSRETGMRGDIWPVTMARAGYMWNGQGDLPCGTGVWTCPKCDFMSNTYGGYGVAEDSVFVYGERYPIDVREPGSLRLSRIERPSNTWLIGDAARSPDTTEKGWYAIWARPNRWAGSHSPAERHAGKVHVCMVDGHVEALTLKEIEDRKITYDVVR